MGFQRHKVITGKVAIVVVIAIVIVIIIIIIIIIIISIIIIGKFVESNYSKKRI